MEEWIKMRQLPDQRMPLLHLYRLLEERPLREHEFGIVFHDKHFRMREGLESLSPMSAVYSTIAQISAMKLGLFVDDPISARMHREGTGENLLIHIETQDMGGRSHVSMRGKQITELMLTPRAMAYMIPRFVWFFDKELYTHYRNLVKKTYIL